MSSSRSSDRSRQEQKRIFAHLARERQALHARPVDDIYDHYQDDAYWGYATGVIHFAIDHPTLRLAVVEAAPVRCEPSPAALAERMRAAASRVRQDATAFPEAVRAAIRDVLRVGGYKPSGRGKPASEFLFAAACEQGLPAVNNLVDVNNLVSLLTALPISMFDADQLGAPAVVRFGRPGERYVFNTSGQSMDISGIPVVCRADDEPVGNAVKDSMLAKVGPETRRVVAVVYGSSKLGPDLLETAARQLRTLLAEFASAGAGDWYLCPPHPGS
jgi:DNA/RNA-binding domain of Phe-tRNA-synthetase-like protein